MNARLDERTRGFAEGRHQTGFRVSDLERDQVETQRDNDKGYKDCDGYVFHGFVFS
jgi:hypothetical protein